MTDFTAREMTATSRFIPPGEARDQRGTLRFVQVAGQLPFVPQRAFWIADVPQGAVRGGHAHATCAEALFALRGSFTLDIVTRGHRRETFRVEEGGDGVVIGAGEWCELRNFSADVLVLVLASEEYRPEGYINDYDTFMRLC